jgi:hypothetical protein
MVAQTAPRLQTLNQSWHYFNRTLFGGKLKKPRTLRLVAATKYEGKCVYRDCWRRDDSVRIFVARNLSEHKRQSALLHEMVHQHQLQVLKTEPDHGPWFASFCRSIERRTGFCLRSAIEP